MHHKKPQKKKNNTTTTTKKKQQKKNKKKQTTTTTKKNQQLKFAHLLLRPNLIPRLFPHMSGSDGKLTVMERWVGAGNEAFFARHLQSSLSASPLLVSF